MLKSLKRKKRETMIQIKSYFITHKEFDDCNELCSDILKNEQGEWTNAHSKTLDEWVSITTSLFKMNTLDDLVKCVNEFQKTKKIPTSTQITEDMVKEARKYRKLHSLGKTFELTRRQPALIARGVNNIPPAELLPLDHHYKDQQQRWQRTKEGQYLQLKPLGEENETHVSVFGDPENPSMDYYRDDRQLAHRYQGVHPKNRAPTNENIYAYNHSKNRTYGSKTSTTGAYKIKGCVDGHAIQACDDQVNLDPKEKEHYPTADKHPHNMYWENDRFGKVIRQKCFEEPAKKNVTSLVQVNVFKNYNNPTKHETHGGKKNSPTHGMMADEIYIRARGCEKVATHLFDNKKETPYKKPNSGKVGEYHAKKNICKDSDFPFAQIIDVNGEDFNSEKQDWKASKSVAKDYETPPTTPHFLFPQIKKEVSKGACFEGQELTKRPLTPNTHEIVIAAEVKCTSLDKWELKTITVKKSTTFHRRKTDKPKEENLLPDLHTKPKQYIKII